MINKGLFTSYRQDWKTPSGLLKELNKEFNFDFDPAPEFRGEFDSLNCEWGNRNYVNPPYTTKLQNAFCKKAVDEYNKGKLIVMLLPARTSTIRFHKWILPNATEIRFIKGRLKFDDTQKPAPFPSMIVIFDPNERR